jgi:hypothetical protein
MDSLAKCLTFAEGALMWQEHQALRCGMRPGFERAGGVYALCRFSDMGQWRQDAGHCG